MTIQDRTRLIDLLLNIKKDRDNLSFLSKKREIFLLTKSLKQCIIHEKEVNMDNEYNLQKLKNISIEDLKKEIDKHNRIGMLFLKKEEELTREEKETLNKTIDEIENEECVTFEESMEELYQMIEEVKNERIYNKAN